VTSLVAVYEAAIRINQRIW